MLRSSWGQATLAPSSDLVLGRVRGLEPPTARSTDGCSKDVHPSTYRYPTLCSPLRSRLDSTAAKDPATGATAWAYFADGKSNSWTRPERIAVPEMLSCLGARKMKRVPHFKDNWRIFPRACLPPQVVPTRKGVVRFKLMHVASMTHSRGPGRAGNGRRCGVGYWGNRERGEQYDDQHLHGRVPLFGYSVPTCLLFCAHAWNTWFPNVLISAKGRDNGPRPPAPLAHLKDKGRAKHAWDAIQRLGSPGNRVVSRV